MLSDKDEQTQESILNLYRAVIDLEMDIKIFVASSELDSVGALKAKAPNSRFNQLCKDLITDSSLDVPEDRRRRIKALQMLSERPAFEILGIANLLRSIECEEKSGDNWIFFEKEGTYKVICYGNMFDKTDINLMLRKPLRSLFANKNSTRLFVSKQVLRTFKRKLVVEQKTSDSASEITFSV